MTADQIRAEIARLQQMLAEIEGGDYSDGRSWGKDPVENQRFFDYLKSREQAFINTGKLDYFRIQDGRLVFDPNLAANESEYQNWLSVKKAQEKQAKEAEKREKLKLYNEMRLNREKSLAEQERRLEAQAMAALNRLKEDPSYPIPIAARKYLRSRGLLPAGYGQPAPMPQPVEQPPQFGESESPQTGSGTMPPAWS